MELKLTLRRAGTDRLTDLWVNVDASVPVGEVALEIARRDPNADRSRTPTKATLRVELDGEVRTVPPHLAIDASGIRSGAVVAVIDASGRFTEESATDAPAATLIVVEGPDVGRHFALRVGANEIGREAGCDVRLSDAMVSKRHARINVTDVVEILDLQSSNGVVVGDERVQRAVLPSEQTALLGETLVKVVHHGGVRGANPVISFNRSPRLDPVFVGDELIAPEPPKPPQRGKFPLIPLLTPILMIGVLYVALDDKFNPTSLIFMAMSPFLLVGTYFENKRSGRKEFREAVATFREGLVELSNQLASLADRERGHRAREYPPSSEVVGSAGELAPLLWTRRPDQRAFLEVRLGLGRRLSRTTVKLPTTNNTAPDLWREMLEVPARWRELEGLPVVGSFAEHGNVGLAGPEESVERVLHSVLAQIVGLHSPAEVILAAIAAPHAAVRWDWLKWLPHTSSPHSPISGEHLVSTPSAAAALVSTLEVLIDERSPGHRSADDPTPLPAVVIVVDDDTPVDRARLVEIAETGPRAGVHLVWVAPRLDRLPAACRAYVDIDPTGARTAAGLITDQVAVVPLAADQLGYDSIVQFARHLASVVDSGAGVDDAADLPRTVPYLELVGGEAGSSSEWIVDRWRANGSIPGEPLSNYHRKHGMSLAATVGRQGPIDAYALDLRSQGPHALVGGTTGAGKSEFLQTWVAALALAHSPARVTFLFVDYKGGAAFKDCLSLPHCVGLVDDLNPHLVRRALVSLNAELKHREHVLQRKGAKDVFELERRGDPETPPSLVIVVDEFAALISELPEFVDGVVNVAQRGRSLGLHLVLATQRPKGVIKDNLRANTNLRIALRVADADDSDDVVGSTVAAGFDPAIPGRAIAKAGPGRLTPFQTGYVGGWSSKGPTKISIGLKEVFFGSITEWDELIDEHAVPVDLGDTDLQLIVANVRAATERASIEAPRPPWLAPLASVYDLARIPQSRTDAELVFGVVDDPEHQRQDRAVFLPDRDGSMAVFGTGGSGKSALLRSLAVVAGLSTRGGPCHVYAIDCGTRQLQLLEALPHVGSVINGDDDERIGRLLRHLRGIIDDRAQRYAAANAGSIAEYRASANQPDEPRLLVLIDNFAQFRQNYETTRPLFIDQLQSVATDGRQVGVHLVITADRGATIPSSLGSAIQRRLVLRLANENDYYGLGDLDIDAFHAATPPGRGFMDGRELQIAVLGGTADVARQANAIARLAEEMQRAGLRSPAPEIQRLSDRITLAELPTAVGSAPTVGVEDESLTPFGFEPGGVFMLVGPARSGKTAVGATLVHAWSRAFPEGRRMLLTAAPGAVSSAAPWTATAIGADEVSAAVDGLADLLGLGDIVFVESAADFSSSVAEAGLETLAKAARRRGYTVIAEGDGASIQQGYGGFLNAIKADRQGIALQPDQTEGDTLFRTPFPRVARRDFPPGRGLYVRAGRVTRVQFALPS